MFSPSLSWLPRDRGSIPAYRIGVGTGLLNAIGLLNLHRLRLSSAAHSRANLLDESGFLLFGCTRHLFDHLGAPFLDLSSVSGVSLVCPPPGAGSVRTTFEAVSGLLASVITVGGAFPRRAWRINNPTPYAAINTAAITTTVTIVLDDFIPETFRA